MKTITFTSSVSTAVEFADRFQMDNLDFAKHIKHQMLAARSRGVCIVTGKQIGRAHV